MSLYLKDPDAVIDHAMLWSGYLDGQMIADSEWRVSPDEAGGVTVIAGTFDAVWASVRLGGGISGRTYSIVNRVLLTDGQVDERTLTLRVEER